MGQHDLAIITCANGNNAYFPEAIHSLKLACRGISGVQCILVANGGWTPPTDIANGFDQVVCVDQAGLGQSRNVGAVSANARWITFFDSDDLIDKNYVNNTINFIRNIDFKIKDFKLFFNEIKFIDQNSIKMPNKKPILEKIPIPIALRLAHPFTGATIVIQKDFFLEAGGYNWRGYGEDYELSTRLYFDFCANMSNKNKESIYLYRQHGGTMSSDRNKKILGVIDIQVNRLLVHKQFSFMFGIAISMARLLISKLSVK